MPKKQAPQGHLPGRKDVHASRQAAIDHYAAMIKERVDLTEDEKKAAVKKYAEGIGADQAQPE